MALNFLVTGVKMLKKSLDKKKMKEGAKKFVGGDKEEKRAKVSKIMDDESSYGEKSKIKKPASIDTSKLMDIDIDKVAKVTPDAAKIDYKVFTQKIDNIVGMTDALAFLTGAQAQQKKDELKLSQKQKEAEKKKKKEAKLEKKDGMLGKVGKGIKKAAQSPLDAMMNFITKMALGALAVFLIANADKIKKIFQTIGENLEGFSKLLRVTIFGIQQGIVLAKKGISAAVKGVGKLFSPIGKAFKAAGSKITTVFKGLGDKIIKMLSKIPGVGFIKNLAKGFMQGFQTVGNVAKNIVQAPGKLIKNIIKGPSKLVKTVLKAPSKLLTKLFGANAAKAAAKSGKLFKVLGKAAKGIKVPVLGPIIVAVTSILSGDPIGKTLFRTLGAVFGGMIGGAIGAALGGVGAPFGLLLGEIVGEFIGSFLYDMFNGDEDGTKGMDFLKKKFGELLTGAGKAGKAVMDFAFSMLSKAGNFIKDGVGRFIEDFPTVDISKIKIGFSFASIGAPFALGKLASLIPGDPLKGMKNDKGEIDKIPNLGLLAFPPLLIPHLVKSLFPGGEKEIEGGTEVGDETAVSGKDDDLKMEKFIEETDKDFNDDEFIGEFTSTSSGTNAVRYEDLEGNEIDPLSSEAENLKKEAKDLFNNSGGPSSDVSAVSSHASYEQSGTKTVLLTEEPKRSEFASESQYQQAMILHMNQKEVLNNLYKTNAKVHLYKI